jgi:hypothetical protein
MNQFSKNIIICFANLEGNLGYGRVIHKVIMLVHLCFTPKPLEIPMYFELLQPFVVQQIADLPLQNVIDFIKFVLGC